MVRRVVVGTAKNLARGTIRGEVAARQRASIERVAAASRQPILPSAKLSDIKRIKHASRRVAVPPKHGSQARSDQTISHSPRIAQGAGLKASLEDVTNHAADFGEIKQVRDILGLSPGNKFPNGTILVALDTEYEMRGSTIHVVEIGLSILDARSIFNVKPGPYPQNWLSRVEHHHFLVDSSERLYKQKSRPFFAESREVSASDARLAVLELLNSYSRPSISNAADFEGVRSTYGRPIASHATPTIPLALVGHGINSDLIVLSNSLGLDFNSSVRLKPPEDERGAVFSNETASSISSTVNNIFDTHNIALVAEEKGVQLPSRRLGPMLRFLGVESKYHRPGVYDLKGAHNASNDAAYTMMALLSFAVKWDEMMELKGDFRKEELANLEESFELKPMVDFWSGPAVGQLRDGDRNAGRVLEGYGTGVVHVRKLKGRILGDREKIARKLASIRRNKLTTRTKAKTSREAGEG